MSLEQSIMEQLKDAMKTKNQGALRALRAIKNEILKTKTAEGFAGEITQEDEQKLLIKMAKQRRDSLDIFLQQGRTDLATTEQEELTVIESFLPTQLTEAEIKLQIQQIIAQTGATGAKDMGKVMGVASKSMAGVADGKVVAALVKQLLQ